MKMNIKREPGAELDELAKRVVDAAFEVHRHLGPGFVESVYEEALCYELGFRNIPFSRQVTTFVNFKGHPVGQSRLDLLIEDRLVVELKAIDCLVAIHTAQVISYLRCTGCHLAILINFNVPLLKMGIRRIVLS